MRLLNRPAIWFASIAAVCIGSDRAQAAERPNIIIVMPDDVGYGDFSCTGNPVVKTPHIDAFYRQSVRFTDFHVSPTCAPTRCALMTGRHEFKSGVTHTIYERERMSLQAHTLPQMLKRAGYTTGIFGKWHLGDEANYQPEKRGFDEVFIHGAGGIGQTYQGSCGDAPGNTYFNPALMHNGKFEKTTGYCTDLFFNQATRWIDQVRGSGKPFFAYITPNAAHAPLQVPDDYFARHRGAVPDDAARFFGMIENIDDNVGRLMQKLDEWNLAENTVVVFLTDNGGTAGTKIFNAGMRGIKNTPYQGGTRVPCFWRWPAKFQAGRDVSTLAAHIDIFPTLAELIAEPLSPPQREQIEGRSLRPLLAGRHVEWPDRALVTHCGRWLRGQVQSAKHERCSIRNGRFTLVNNAELYDLANDPGETTNVIDAHPQVVAELRAAYDKWWNDVVPRLENEDAVGPDVNPYKALYWKQFGGGPDEALRRRMKWDPANQR